MNVGDIIEGKVIDIKSTHMIIEIDGKITGLVHVSEISDYFVSKISSMFHMNEKYYFKLIEKVGNKKVKLSWKSLKPRFLKDPFMFKIQETENGFKNLKDKTKKEVDND